MVTVYTKRGAVVGNYTPKNAALLLSVQEEDLNWAIEEHGRCDGIDAVALPFGERFERYDEWYAKQPR
jgi:hypothetical protein